MNTEKIEKLLFVADFLENLHYAGAPFSLAANRQCIVGCMRAERVISAWFETADFYRSALDISASDWVGLTLYWTEDAGALEHIIANADTTFTALIAWTLAFYGVQHICDITALDAADALRFMAECEAA